MILPAQHIRKRAVELGMIVPFSERTIFNGKTFGLGPATYDCRCRQSLILHPYGMNTFEPSGTHARAHGFVLASTIEWVNLPNNIRATVCDKSSWARKGLAVQNTKIDPGFRGHITLELSNHGHEKIVIDEGDAICQLEFALLLEPTEMPYSGKYQDQPDRPVEAIDGTGVWT